MEFVNYRVCLLVWDAILSFIILMLQCTLKFLLSHFANIQGSNYLFGYLMHKIFKAKKFSSSHNREQQKYSDIKYSQKVFRSLTCLCIKNSVVNMNFPNSFLMQTDVSAVKFGMVLVINFEELFSVKCAIYACSLIQQSMLVGIKENKKETQGSLRGDWTLIS